MITREYRNRRNRMLTLVKNLLNEHPEWHRKTRPEVISEVATYLVINNWEQQAWDLKQVEWCVERVLFPERFQKEPQGYGWS